MALNFPCMPERLTKAEAQILDYISNNTEGFLFSSIGQLSKILGVSEATISRFVRHLGCKDYKEFKQIVMQQVSFEGPAAKMARTLNSEEQFSLSSFLSRQQEYLQKTLEGMEWGAFQQAVEAVLKARRVFIHGKSASAALAQLLMFRLRRLGIETLLLPSGGSEVLEGLAQAGPDDLVIMFSFSKVSYEGKIILEYQKEAGYKTAAFTSRMFIPDQEKADIQLFVYRGEAREYHAMTGPAALVDALVVAVSEQMGAASAEKLSGLHRLKKTYAPNR